VLGSCSVHDAEDAAGRDDASVDPDAPNPDAAIDAGFDAAPLVCDDMGLACAGNSATFTCGGHCWVRCTTSRAHANAKAQCLGWSGNLGEIDDATEQACVAMHLNDKTWIGLEQPTTATQPGLGWTWNGATAVTFTNWQSGAPNDSDGNENQQEQCGHMEPNGTWDDEACSSTRAFFCER
jgi:hypothetical protein